MDDVAARAKRHTPWNDKARNLAGEATSLDGRYGQIGISAVAAVVRYQGAAKNPAYAPVPTKWTDDSDEAA